MKKTALLVFAALFLLTATAFADDGFKAYVGYSVGYQEHKDIYGGSYEYNAKNTGTLHGPNVDLRYEGQYFGRINFDYFMLSGGKTKYTGYGDLDYDLSMWQVEGDFGYRVYNQGGLKIWPYAGFGYMRHKITDSNYSLEWISDSTPYAAVGALMEYESGAWSVGLDAAALISFGGESKYSDAGGEYKMDTSVGWGARVQIPVSYAIKQKKAGGVGIMVFATPFFQYLDSGVSDKTTIISEQWDVKYKNYLYGVKAGIGFAF
jgi:hypothetical protein